MASRSPYSGIGRGNAPGSRKGQFKSGMPSANPHGRPKRPRFDARNGLQQALLRALSKRIPVRQNGVERLDYFANAMIEDLLANFSKASVPHKIQIIRFVTEATAQAGEVRYDIPPQTLNEFIDQLAAEAERAGILEQQSWLPK